MKKHHWMKALTGAAAALALSLPMQPAFGSSHREAPLISNDPLADNTDLYAFRSPDDPNTITIIANYIPLELPEGGPNYASFGENIQYLIHIDNDAAKKGDEIVYRFTFTKTNEDPTTFFNIRLGKENLKTTYTAEKSTDGGKTFQIIVNNGVVPPSNIGPRSIEGAAGLNKSYEQLMNAAITTATSGETVFCGPVDDPFFVDLGGIFDLGQTRLKDGQGFDRARDAVAGFNCHAIALKIPIQLVQKNGKPVSEAKNILDGDYTIGVWTSASRPKVTTLRTDGKAPDVSGEWIQVSRLGMPLTNEAVVPIGMKDYWNAITPYDADEVAVFAKYFMNPELALYMDDSQFGGAVPAFAKLRIQSKSLGSFDFRNGKDGLFGLPESARAGTALSDQLFGGILLGKGEPRRVDVLPAFYTGVPNVPPYQLATGKNGNPLAVGKPFANNFLPSLGDMLRLNMAVPVTPRNDPKFSSLGLVQAAVLGLTDPAYNQNADLQFIPNMDGFPNGRRLEDDVTRIELQAVAGIVLAAVGLWYDDYIPDQSPSPVTPQLLGVLTYSAGPEANDLPFRSQWPYMAPPHRGYDYVKKLTTGIRRDDDPTPASALGISAPVGQFVGQNFPNPATTETALRFHVNAVGNTRVIVYDTHGNQVATLVNQRVEPGTYVTEWEPTQDVPSGTYVAQLVVNGAAVSSMKITLER